MKLLYLECRAGISGDMTTAALLDLLGEQVWPELVSLLESLGLPGATANVGRIRKGGFAAVDFETAPESGHPPHRTLPDIEKILRAADLAPEVLATSLSIFQKVAEAEAEAHGKPSDHVHFHEVGAADSILDIMAIAWAYHRLAPDRVVCSALPLGSGTVECAHGTIPIPAPATVILTRDVPVYGGGIEGETVTPTGAAAAVTLADSFGPLPPGTITKIGIGAGKAERPQLNVLRAYLAETDASTCATAEANTVVQIETTIDDMIPEAYTPLMDRLLAAGALDVTLTPVQMKKGRPGINISSLCRPEDRATLSRLLLVHSTTFGVRYHELQRDCLPREIVEVKTPYGPVHVKKGLLDGKVIKTVPEYEDCRARAEQADVPYLTVYDATLAASRD